MQTDNAVHARKKIRWLLVAAVVAGVVLFCGAALCGEAYTPENALDSVLAEAKASAMTWGSTLTRVSLYLFWTLAMISLVWNLGSLMFNKPEIGDFFHRFVYWIITTGVYLFGIKNAPLVFGTIVSGFMKMGTLSVASGEEGEVITPGQIVGQGVTAFEIVLKNIKFPGVVESFWNYVSSGFDTMETLNGYVVGMMVAFAGFVMMVSATVIGCCVAIQLIKAYFLVYAGYFYLSFAGSEYTRPMAQNYFRSVLVAGGELLATFLAFSLFSDIFTDLVADLVNKAAVGGKGVTVEGMIPIVMSLVMCAYFVAVMPRTLGKIAKGVAAGMQTPFSTRSATHLLGKSGLAMFKVGKTGLNVGKAGLRAGMNRAFRR